jgi:hypothetical protein
VSDDDATTPLGRRPAPAVPLGYESAGDTGARTDDTGATQARPGTDETGPDDRSAGDTGAGSRAGADPARRRRRLIIGGIVAGVVVLLLLACVAAAAVIRAGAELVDRADDTERRYDRLAEACLELETRLNRIVPPGATGGDPRRRADAVRDENAALRPLLVELEAMSARREHREDRRRAEWASGWRQLVEARTAYAEALDRQATAGDPAFFLAPREPGDGSVIETIERSGPDSCAGAVRRLGHPDL